MTTRRNFVGAIAAIFGATLLRAQSTHRRKWYITGGVRAAQTDCDIEPIVCYGTDRVDAIAHSGITVWSEEEWQHFQENYGKDFQAGCDAPKKAGGKDE